MQYVTGATRLCMLSSSNIRAKARGVLATTARQMPRVQAAVKSQCTICYSFPGRTLAAWLDAVHGAACREKDSLASALQFSGSTRSDQHPLSPWQTLMFHSRPTVIRVGMRALVPSGSHANSAPHQGRRSIALRH